MSGDNWRIRPGLESRLEQRLTPQLLLNIKILQLPALELRDLIEAELEQNPALEQVEDDFNPEEDQVSVVEGDGCESGTEMVVDITGGGKGGDEGDGKESGELTGESDELSRSGQGDDGEEFSFVDLLPPDGWETPLPSGGEPDDDGVRSEVVADPVLTFQKTLLPKLKEEIPPQDVPIAVELIEWLDESGFLTGSEEEMVESLGVEPERLRQVLYRLQRIPPGGIGCRSVREALLVQLELKGVAPDALECRLLREGWELLEKRDTAGLARLFGTDEEGIRAAIERLANLEPKPARQFVNQAVEYVSPDFSVEWRGNRLEVVMNDDNIPRLRLSRQVRQILLSPKAFGKEQVKFAREKLERARIFLKAIEARRRLLRNLVEWIVRTQDGFFLTGSQERLKPATLRDAAQVLKVHEATISRAISGKYLETPYGIYPLKFFFRSGKSDLSRTAIQGKIKAIIDMEDKRAPVSDDEICERLKKEGVEVSRRTVAKYREEMGIPSSRERRLF